MGVAKEEPEGISLGILLLCLVIKTLGAGNCLLADFRLFSAYSAIAETSTGCLLAGSAIGRKGEPAERTGRSAAEELVTSVRAGGCVDEHLQDQVSAVLHSCNSSIAIFFLKLAKITTQSCVIHYTIIKYVICLQNPKTQ